MKFLLLTDLVVLFEVFQRFSDWSQKTFGLTNFWWAKFFAKVGFIALALDYIISFVDGTAVAFIVLDTVFLIWFAVLLYYFSNICEKLDEKYANGYKYVNPIMLHLIIGRIFSVFFLLLQLVVATLYFTSEVPIATYFPFTIVVFAFTFGMYFISCTPDPPGESKVKKWLKDAKEKVSKSLSPVPAPEPSTG